MDKNTNNPQQNRSMFLYTALIFLVALILIIIASFGQTNISSLRRTAQPPPEQTETADDELAVLLNTVSTQQAENERLQGELDTYDALLHANACLTEEKYDEAEKALSELTATALSDEQLVLYNKIEEEINKGKE